MPYLICSMKMFIELSIEIVCLFITSFYDDPVDVMMNYIALGCIANLDEVYYNTIRSPLKVQLEAAEFELPIENFVSISYWKEFSCLKRFILKILKPILYIYHILYFHLFHYLIFVFLFWRKDVFGNFVKGVYRHQLQNDGTKDELPNPSIMPFDTNLANQLDLSAFQPM